MDKSKRETIMKMMSIYTAVIMGTAAAVSFTGCSGDRYERSTGEHIDDTSTNVRVKHALSADPDYKYSDVVVSTFKGTVQLSGFVNQKPQKERAETIAKGVEGVKDVVNNITLKP
jgi:hyperosmotically inducible protein